MSDEAVRKGFGLRLKAAREARGMTQQQVADMFDVKKATVSAWETGVGVPDALRLRRLAKLYGVSADALLWEDSLTTESMQFAAQYDALSDAQRRMFKTMWLAYFEQSKTDAEVEKHLPATPPAGVGMSARARAKALFEQTGHHRPPRQTQAPAKKRGMK